jgi:hypothetical protein
MTKSRSKTHAPVEDITRSILFLRGHSIGFTANIDARS